MINFTVLERSQFIPSSGKNTAYLQIDYWNDYSFITMFHLTLHDENGKFHHVGNVKIGFKGQDITIGTYATLEKSFSQLPDGYFSLGEESEYYLNIRKELSQETSEQVLQKLHDVVFNPQFFNEAKEEEVFSISLLRFISLSQIEGQFKRIINGQPPLTNFAFEYHRPQDNKFAEIRLEFRVDKESKPSSNIHAVIGRNGVGKTTLLNGIIESVTKGADSLGKLYEIEDGYVLEDLKRVQINNSYFSSLVSVSFSAFDPFDPPPEQSNPALGTRYYYIGLKDSVGVLGDSVLKNLHTLQQEFCESLSVCLNQPGKKTRWSKAIMSLQSDDNFADMHLDELSSVAEPELESKALHLIKKMSSGHAVVLLTITKLVATVEEKTLVLIDEPESHLHPPLLSAFIRALSELLHDRNGVAIIATHSPVVLQEVPRSSVWKITRSRLALSHSRPEIETFGENVGILTREIFGLEVTRSGFHQLLENAVADNKTFEEIVDDYNHQLGFEAQAILRAMIVNRDGVGDSE